MKDWNGNRTSIFSCHGASNYSTEEREENDYYATDPHAVDFLLENEAFYGNVWENACGEGHLSKKLEQNGILVFSSDLIDRGFGETGIDFFKASKMMCGSHNIITNPPYKFAMEWVYKSMELLPQNGKLALFLKISFLEGKKRKAMFAEYPPKVIYVSSSRVGCAKNGDFEKNNVTAVGYAWYVWEKGYSGETVVKWVN